MGKMARLATTIRLPTCMDIVARADEDLIVSEGQKKPNGLMGEHPNSMEMALADEDSEGLIYAHGFMLPSTLAIEEAAPVTSAAVELAAPESASHISSTSVVDAFLVDTEAAPDWSHSLA